MLISFLCQTDKFISTGVMPSQKFWQWGDDINTKDDITPFDGISITLSTTIILHKYRQQQQILQKSKN